MSSATVILLAIISCRLFTKRLPFFHILFRSLDIFSFSSFFSFSRFPRSILLFPYLSTHHPLYMAYIPKHVNASHFSIEPSQPKKFTNVDMIIDIHYYQIRRQTNTGTHTRTDTYTQKIDCPDSRYWWCLARHPAQIVTAQREQNHCGNAVCNIRNASLAMLVWVPNRLEFRLFCLCADYRASFVPTLIVLCKVRVRRIDSDDSNGQLKFTIAPSTNWSKLQDVVGRWMLFNFRHARSNYCAHFSALHYRFTYLLTKLFLLKKLFS